MWLTSVELNNFHSIYYVWWSVHFDHQIKVNTGLETQKKNYPVLLFLWQSWATSVVVYSNAGYFMQPAYCLSPVEDRSHPALTSPLRSLNAETHWPPQKQTIGQQQPNMMISPSAPLLHFKRPPLQLTAPLQLLQTADSMKCSVFVQSHWSTLRKREK